MSHPHLTPPNALEMATLKRMAHHNDLATITAAGAVPTSGIVTITGGTGLALTLAAPKKGDKLVVTVGAISSGSVVITTASGVLFDGTNNTATMNAAADSLTLVYASESAAGVGQWAILANTSTSMSSV
jgi:hypothetical protein